MTDVDQYADVTFTRGNGSSVKDQTEVIYSFDNVILSNYALMEVGGTFLPRTKATISVSMSRAKTVRRFR